MAQHFGGSHPKILEMDKLQDRINELKREVEKERDEQRKLLVPIWKIEDIHVVVEKKLGYDWDKELVEGTEWFEFTEKLQNPEDFTNHMNLYGSISQSPNESHHSVKYYRVAGVLLHGGSGWICLKDKQPCSDEEWELLKTGDIPEKFKR
jgi:hypothetical protein